MASDRFNKFIPFLWEWECVKNKKGEVLLESDPDDPGNYVGGKLIGTKYGIDARSHPRENIRALTEEKAREIYWREYWVPNRCETMPKGLGEVHFNACVNAGAGRGNKCLAAAGGSFEKYLDEQEAFYRRLAKAKPRLSKYLKGWLNRTTALRKYVRNMG